MKVVRRGGLVVISGIVSALILSIAFTNCAEYADPESAAGAASASLALSTCESDLFKVFEETYRPFLNNSATCLQCHRDQGASPYALASADSRKAFDVFRQIGVDQVDKNAVDPSHGPGRTGPELQARLDEIRLAWNQGASRFDLCVAAVPAGGGGPSDLSEALLLADRNEKALYFDDGRVVTMSWYLQGGNVQPSSISIPAVFSIDVRVAYEGVGETKRAVGYAFRNPRVQMTSGEIELEVEGIVPRINGIRAVGSEPFTFARALARGIDTTVILNKEIVSPQIEVSSGDRISIGIGWFQARARTDNPPTPPTPAIQVNDGKLYASSLNNDAATVNVRITNDATARRWCLTLSSTRPASTDQACDPLSTDPLKGWLTTRPTNVSFTALLGSSPTDGQKATVYLWVANSDLKLSMAPVSGTVEFDGTRPAPMIVSSANMIYNMDVNTGTQVVQLVNLAPTASDIMEWCVREAVAGADLNSNGCRFSPTAPTHVALADGGERVVAVFVRDKAGNTSQMSYARLGGTDGRTRLQDNIRNTLGRITHAQLVGTTARGAFAQKCAQCHDATGSGGSARWNAYDFGVSTTTSTMANLRDHGAVFREVVAGGTPPTSGGSAHPAVALNAVQRILIQTWLANGTPQQ